MAFADVARLASEILARRWLTPELWHDAPTGPRRDEWIAARVLLAMLINNGPLPRLQKTSHGKPWHPALPDFNISNCATRVAVLIGGGAVGCDLERIRPRARFMAIARHSFAAPLCEWLEALPDAEHIPQFWRLWTAHEAVLKQQGGTVWQMSELNLPLSTLCPSDCYLQHVSVGDWLIACCGEQPFPEDFSPELVIVSTPKCDIPHQ